jgi:hypothetical protein
MGKVEKFLRENVIVCTHYRCIVPHSFPVVEDWQCRWMDYLHRLVDSQQVERGHQSNTCDYGSHSKDMCFN